MTVFAYSGQVSTPGMLWVLCWETLAIPRIAQGPVIWPAGWEGMGLPSGFQRLMTWPL